MTQLESRQPKAQNKGLHNTIDCAAGLTSAITEMHARHPATLHQHRALQTHAIIKKQHRTNTTAEAQDDTPAGGHHKGKETVDLPHRRKPTNNICGRCQPIVKHWFRTFVCRASPQIPKGTTGPTSTTSTASSASSTSKSNITRNRGTRAAFAGPETAKAASALQSNYLLLIGKRSRPVPRGKIHSDIFCPITTHRANKRQIMPGKQSFTRTGQRNETRQRTKTQI